MVLVVGYAFNSIPELVGEPGNSEVKPLNFFQVYKFCAVAKTRRLTILYFSSAGEVNV